ncbi:MAG: sensor histidine kinase [Hyphomicrobiales bacterium]
MRPSFKLLRTSTFRLSALYLLLFALSVGAILGYVYWNTAVLLEQQTDETIRAEIQGLAEQYRFRGLAGVADTIRRRSSQDSDSVYLLFTPDGRPVTGNLTALPVQASSEEGWIEFPYSAKAGTIFESHTARAFLAELPGDYGLIVGRDVESMRQFATLIRTTLIGALLITLVLGLGGGIVMSRNFLRRVDAITAASRSIMAGDLSGRMPVKGTGDELDRLAQSLNEMLDQIARLMSAMQEVSSNVAHDLRTPLTRLKARAESALREGSPYEYKDALERTIDESDRLLNAFNALLSIARAEAGEAREGLRPIDAAEIVTDVAELYEPLAEEQGGSLEVDTEPNLNIRANRQLLAQAVSNLLDNGLKYGIGKDAAGAELTITGAVEGDEVVITVGDRGAGIGAQDRERVVERFVRLDESRSKPGNGLGLSLVAGVMKLHGGRLVLEDNAPGLKAKLILPRLA